MNQKLGFWKWLITDFLKEVKEGLATAYEDARGSNFFEKYMGLTLFVFGWTFPFVCLRGLDFFDSLVLGMGIAMVGLFLVLHGHYRSKVKKI